MMVCCCTVHTSRIKTTPQALASNLEANAIEAEDPTGAETNRSRTGRIHRRFREAAEKVRLLVRTLKVLTPRVVEITKPRTSSLSEQVADDLVRFLSRKIHAASKRPAGKIGTVYVKDDYAIKYVPYHAMSEGYAEETDNEVKVNLALFNSDRPPSFIPEFHGLIKWEIAGKLQYALVFERMQGDLETLSDAEFCAVISRPGGGGSNPFVKTLRRLVRKLRRRGYYHNDITEFNVMYDKDKQWRLIDLGMADPEALMAGQLSVDHRALQNIDNNLQYMTSRSCGDGSSSEEEGYSSDDESDEASGPQDKAITKSENYARFKRVAQKVRRMVKVLRVWAPRVVDIVRPESSTLTKEEADNLAKFISKKIRAASESPAGKIGTVYVKNDYAIKYVPYYTLSQSFAEEVDNEVKVNLELFNGKRPPAFVPKFHGLIKWQIAGKLQYGLVFEKMEGDLETLSDEEFCRVVERPLGGGSSIFANALESLLGNLRDGYGYYHNDVTEFNIMYDKDHDWRLIDLGMADREPLMAGSLSIDERGLQHIKDNLEAIMSRHCGASSSEEEYDSDSDVYRMDEESL
jgi:tRNA A-37 threonylcarbamoyl transferase component Bud32